MPHRILVLSGFACTRQIWQQIQACVSPDTVLTLVDWPTDLTSAFHQIADYSGWLAQQYPVERYETIIGHSMGGLVAADLVKKQSLSVCRLILVESFLLPPGPFFQNLVMPNADPQIIQSVTDMLKTQRPFYSPQLQQSLRDVNLTAERALPEVPTHAIYGDRGSLQPNQAIQALSWPADLAARVPVTLIPHACHFPMLENPGRFNEVINRLTAS